MKNIVSRLIILILFLIIILVAFNINGSDSRPKVGSRIPNFKLVNYFDDDNKYLRPTDFHGKYLILDFWATWCGSCIPGLKHLSEIQKEFSDDIVIIAVSNEPKEKLDNYFLNRSYDIRFALDIDSTLFDKFQIQTLPHTVLISPKGKIMSHTYPDELTKEKMKIFINGGFVPLKQKPEWSEFSIKNKKEDKSFYAKIEKSNNDFGMFYSDAERLMFHGSVIEIYQYAYEMSSFSRVIVDSNISKKYDYREIGLYRLEVQLPERNRELMFKTARNLLDSEFDINVGLTTKTTDVKILKVVDKTLIPFSNGDEISSLNSRGIESIGQKRPINDIVRLAENILEIPTIDETGISDSINYKINFSNYEVLAKELKNYGLMLIDTQREVDYLVLDEK